MNPVRPQVGDAVFVRWIDSGAGWVGVPGDHFPALSVGETHGRVIAFGNDPQLPLGAQRTLILAMCSNGPDDERSEMAAVWWPSVIHCQIVEPGQDRPKGGDPTCGT